MSTTSSTNASQSILHVQQARARRGAVSRSRQYLAAHPEIEEGALAVSLRVLNVEDADVSYRRKRVLTAEDACERPLVRHMYVEIDLPPDALPESLLRSAEAAYSAYVDAELSKAPKNVRKRFQLDPSVKAADLLHVEYRSSRTGPSSVAERADSIWFVRNMESMQELAERTPGEPVKITTPSGQPITLLSLG